MRAGGGSEATSESSRCGHWHDAATSNREGCELQRGEDVVSLQVGILGEQLVDLHATREQLEQTLDGVAQPSNTNRRVPVADGWVRRDALKPGQTRNDISVASSEPALTPTRDSDRKLSRRVKADP